MKKISNLLISENKLYIDYVQDNDNDIYDEVYNIDDDELWKLTIDISDIWSEYENKKISLQSFNNKYYKKILSYKDEIINNLSDETWFEIIETLNKLVNLNDEKKSISIWNELYNIYDSNDIKLIINNK